MFFHLIQTYQPGPRFRAGSLTKAAIIRICKRLAEQWGVEVVPGRNGDGFIEAKVSVGYKVCRMHAYPHRYPWIKGGEMTTWANDETPMFPDLKDCALFLKGFDGASWLVHEVADICRALEEEGCTIKISSVPRKFECYDTPLRLWAMWCEKTRGLKEGDLITEDAALGLLHLGGVDVSKEVRFGEEGVPISACIDAYFAPPAIKDPVKIVVGDASFEVRRGALVDNSDVFKAMLNSGMVETLTNTVDLTDLEIPAKTLRKILQELDQFRPRIPPRFREEAERFGKTYMVTCLA